jgi:uncharacterized repeat protein (TIGR01451 family)
MQIIKTVNDLTPMFGDNLTFTLTASNEGQNDATNVVVNDLLPNGYSFVSATPSTGAYDEITGIWTIGSMNYPSTETLEIVATVNLTGTYENTATITADQPDPEPDNNISTVTPVPSNCDVSAPSSTPTLCVNTVLTSITHSTVGATGIGQVYEVVKQLRGDHPNQRHNARIGMTHNLGGTGVACTVNILGRDA